MSSTPKSERQMSIWKKKKKKDGERTNRTGGWGEYKGRRFDPVPLLNSGL